MLESARLVFAGEAYGWSGPYIAASSMMAHETGYFGQWAFVLCRVGHSPVAVAVQKR